MGAGLFVGGWGTSWAQDVIRCGSMNGGYASCPTPWRGAILLEKESRSSCQPGRDWGFDHGQIWVDNGCRALFQRAGRSGGEGWVYRRDEAPLRPPPSHYVPNRPEPSHGWNGGPGKPPSARARTVQCGSVDKAYRFCPAGIEAGQQVVLEHNQSDKRCKWARDWGVQGDGIWVSNGCRAVFSIR